MRITEKRLRSIIRNVIAESNPKSAVDYQDEMRARYHQMKKKLHES